MKLVPWAASLLVLSLVANPAAAQGVCTDNFEPAKVDQHIAGCTEVMKSEMFSVFTGAEQAQVFYYRSLGHITKRNFKDAIADLSEAFKRKPDSDYLLGLRGQMRTSDQDYDGAVKDLTEAIAMAKKPRHDLYAARARAFVMKDDYKSAAADVKMGLSLKPDDAGLQKLQALLSVKGN